jgi:microcystin-dependent protein
MTQHPQDYRVTRVISHRVLTEDIIPGLEIPVESYDPGLFKNEIAINSYGSGTLINDCPSLWLRVGPAEREELTDKLIRIGNVLVTDDLDTAINPTLPIDVSTPNILWTGTGWLRNTDGAYFVHNGTEYFRITPVPADELTEGLIRLSTDVEVLEGVEETTAITPSNLTLWKDNYELLSRSRAGRILYVDYINGDDSLSNDGIDEKYPFLTLNRALLEVSRQSFVEGIFNDIAYETTIIVKPCDVVIDNRPGVGDYTTLTAQLLTATKAINPVTLVATVTAISFDADGYTELAINGALTAGLTVGAQIWNQLDGQGIVVSVDNAEVVIKRVKGVWTAGDNLIFADYSVFNSPDGGVIVPRGCTILGVDLRKTIFRPRYVGDVAAWEAAVAGSTCVCSSVGTTAIFKLTGGSYISSISFKDNLAILETHHLCIAFTFASALELADGSYGYYQKVFRVLGQTVDPAIILDEFQPDLLENNIVSNAINNLVTDSDGFLLINNVKGSSPYISNCSLLSRFGMRGLLIDGSQAAGFKSIVVERFTVVSLQSDIRAFEVNTSAPGDKSYKEAWRHVSFEAINNGYGQLVSCFSIGAAVHYRSNSGGELNTSNCFLNFGDTAFEAVKYSTQVYSQDENIASLKFIPPKPINSSTQGLALGSYREDLSSSTRLFVFDDELTEERIAPFSLLGGETLYLKTPTGVEYTAELVDSAPFFQQDVGGEWYINVKGTDNNIFAATEDIDSFFIEIRRTPDNRQPEDRIYWLQVEGITEPKRAPKQNYVLRFNSTGSPGYTLSTDLWVAAVRGTGSSGALLPTGVYQLALMSAPDLNDSLDELYPDLNLDEPDANPATSSTYKAMDTLLASAGVSPAVRTATLIPADTEQVIPGSGGPQTLYFDFLKPSTIRAFGVGIEWVGFNNYDTALPIYQEFSYSSSDYLKKIKRERYGGRVYHVGMTEDGRFIVDSLSDASAGEDSATAFQDTSKILKNLTVTNRLFMYPGSKMQLGGTNITLDSTTNFTSPITTDFSTYASQSIGGFVRFATPTEANLLTANNLAISPFTIPTATETQKGIQRLATAVEANALTLVDALITPGTIPLSTQTQKGIVRLSTSVEANDLTSLDTAITPGTLPIATQTQKGLSQLATSVEANALTDLTKVLTPGTLPKATETQEGVNRFASDVEVSSFSDDLVALNPADVKNLILQLKEEEIGVCKLYAGTVPPDGYLLVRGQAVSRTTYAKLFAIIGTTWGVGDGATTFNLPPSERVFIGAGVNPGFIHGNIGGVASSTLTTTENGAHTPTAVSNVTGLSGGHTPAITVLDGGGHTPVITVIENGAHTHTLSVDPNGAQVLTATSFANDNVTITSASSGSHTHTVTLNAAGGHAHWAVTAEAGGHTPGITILGDGAHNHTVNSVSQWGPYNFTGYNTASGGDHTPIIVELTHPGHSHGGVTGLSAGTGNVQSGSGADTATGNHFHYLSIETGGNHGHGTYSLPVPGHIHGIPDLVVPAHSHTVINSAVGTHTHGLTIDYVSAHSHGLTTSSVDDHNHTVNSVTNHTGHTHGLTITGHTHTIEVDAVLDHIHTGNAVSNGSHIHNLNITPVADHNHNLNINPVPDHNHSITMNAVPNHTHDLTVSTLQPYAAMNVIIYTGVY